MTIKSCRTSTTHPTCTTLCAESRPCGVSFSPARISPRLTRSAKFQCSYDRVRLIIITYLYRKARRLSRNVPKTEFRIIRQARGARFVLVADVSGSMQNFVVFISSLFFLVLRLIMRYCNGKNRIGNLNKSVRSWIKNDLPVGSKLGIVQFR